MELKRELITSKEALTAKISSCTEALNKKFHGGDDMRHITVCGGTGCLSAESREIIEKFKKQHIVVRILDIIFILLFIYEMITFPALNETWIMIFLLFQSLKV